MTDPVDFIPAGPCCCEQASWFGKRPNVAPLTDTFIRTAVKGGSIIPPHNGAEHVILWRGILCIAAICIAMCWAVVQFWPK